MADFDDWSIAEALPSGAQAKAYVVRRSGDESPYFLKALPPSKRERRARFYREASTYRTLQHHRIPRLVATNADQFEDERAALYLVTDYVDGPTAEAYLNRQGPLPVDAAFAAAEALADVLVYAHGQDAVHRDLKPANLIFRGGVPGDPVLVDFGIGFLASEAEAHKTEIGQELGNRFLRLPEFSAGSSQKRDPRSDITLLSGLLLYLLTGVTPRDLRDSNGHAPHQRPEAAAALAKLEAIDRWALLNLFDRSFQVALSSRWPDCKEFLQGLAKIPRGKAKADGMSQDDAIRRMQEILAGQAEGERAGATEILRNVVRRLEASQNEVAQQLGDKVATQRGNYEFKPDLRRWTGSVALVRASDHQGFTPALRVQLEGDETVLTDQATPARPIFRYETQALLASPALTPVPEFTAYLTKGMLSCLEGG